MLWGTVNEIHSLLPVGYQFEFSLTQWRLKIGLFNGLLVISNELSLVGLSPAT